MSFGARLRSRLEQLGRSQSEVARSLGLSARRFGHYVNDKREPDYATLARICEKLSTHPNYLLGFDEDPELTPGQASSMREILRDLNEIKRHLERDEDS